jgi:hypothetical protein
MRKSKSPAPTLSGGILCENCGHYNLTPHLTCDQCGAALSTADLSFKTTRSADIPLRKRRPGCITAYALIAGTICAPLLLMFVLVLTSGDEWPATISFTSIALLLIMQIAAVGLWQMKMWGRHLQMAGIAFLITLMLYQFLLARWTISGFMFSGIGGGIFFYWLYKNGDLFD